MLYNYAQSRSRYPMSDIQGSGMQRSGMMNTGMQRSGFPVSSGYVSPPNGGTNCSSGGNYGGNYGGNVGIDESDPCGAANAGPPIDVNGPEVAQLIEEIVAQHIQIREPKVTRQVQHLQNDCGPGKVINVTRRLPEQMPDQIERIICSTLPQDVINLYIEKPCTPPAQINTQKICNPGKPPLIQPYLVNLPCDQTAIQPGPGNCIDANVGSSGIGSSAGYSQIGLGSMSGHNVLGQGQSYGQGVGVQRLQSMPAYSSGINVVNQGFSGGAARNQPYWTNPQPQVLRAQTVGSGMGSMRTGMYQTPNLGGSSQSMGGYGVPASSYGLQQGSYGSPMAYNQVMPQSQTRYF